MKGTPVIALAVLTASLAAAPVAAAAPPTVAYGRCDTGTVQRDVAPARTRLGPLTFIAGWDGYADWPNMERQRNSRDGTYYAKSAMNARRGTIASLSIAPAYRAVADFIYGQGPNGSHVLSDVVRIRACKRHTSFYSGGLVVRGPTCVGIEVRERGSRRVYRQMVSINMGANCPAH
jgi:hypothetical protein